MEKVHVEVNRCKGCGLCVEFCPRHCLELAAELNAIGYHPARNHDAEKCTSCALCADMCPEGAITIHRKKRSKSA